MNFISVSGLTIEFYIPIADDEDYPCCPFSASGTQPMPPSSLDELIAAYKLLKRKNF